MSPYVLILLVQVGAIGSPNNVTMTQFTTKERCESAGQAAVLLARDSVRDIKYTCAKQ